jgi:hypothetical protein
MDRCFRPCPRLRPFVTLAIVICFLLRLAPGFAQTYQVDAQSSQALTAYLREHRLPLVGAQVLTDAAGERRIVLYGFVATDFGKSDAARKALEFTNKASQTVPKVENRIEVRPDIARMSPRSNQAGESNAGNGANPGSKSLDEILNDIDQYGVNVPPGELTQPP